MNFIDFPFLLAKALTPKSLTKSRIIPLYKVRLPADIGARSRRTCGEHTCGGHVAHLRWACRERDNGEIYQLTARGTAAQVTEWLLSFPAVGTSRTEQWGNLSAYRPRHSRTRGRMAAFLSCGRHTCSGHVANGTVGKSISLPPAAQPHT